MSIPYPSTLPCASRIEGHSATIFAGLVRTPMQAGNTRQRRSHHAIPHQISLAFVMHQTKYAEWLDWVNAHAWDEWVEMELPGLEAGRAGTDLATILVRFVTDLRAELLPVFHLWYWRVRVDCEWLPFVEEDLPPVVDECPTNAGPFLLRDDFVGASQSLATYAHDVNIVGAGSWTVSGSVITDGAGQAIVSPNSGAIINPLAMGYPRRIGLRINAATTAVEKILSFALSSGIEGTIEASAVQLYFPFTEGSNFTAFNWDYAVGKEIILEYNNATDLVMVYVCGELAGGIAADGQMGTQSYLGFGRPAGTTGDVYLDYVWVD